MEEVAAIGEEAAEEETEEVPGPAAGAGTQGGSYFCKLGRKRPSPWKRAPSSCLPLSLSRSTACRAIWRMERTSEREPRARAEPKRMEIAFERMEREREGGREDKE